MPSSRPTSVPSPIPFDDYLHALGLPPPALADDQDCELCGCADATLIRDRVLMGRDRWVALEVRACDRCGLLFQRPRFAPDFYLDYYARSYRRVTTGQTEPAAAYVEDQIARGRKLAAALAGHLPRPGRLLDLGCAAGGLMKPFLDAGWSGLGVDPDEGAVRYGRETLDLPVAVGAAEDFDIDAGPFDLIVITGSLEHVADPNRVLSRAHQAAAAGAHLLIEGWGLGQARQLLGLGHNQRRFLTLRTIQLFMLKHGWSPVLATAEPLTGPTRPGSVFVLGRRVRPDPPVDLDARIRDGLRDPPDATLKILDEWGIG